MIIIKVNNEFLEKKKEKDEFMKDYKEKCEYWESIKKCIIKYSMLSNEKTNEIKKIKEETSESRELTLVSIERIDYFIELETELSEIKIPRSLLKLGNKITKGAKQMIADMKTYKKILLSSLNFTESSSFAIKAKAAYDYNSARITKLWNKLLNHDGLELILDGINDLREDMDHEVENYKKSYSEQ